MGVLSVANYILCYGQSKYLLVYALLIIHILYNGFPVVYYSGKKIHAVWKKYK